MYPVCFVVDERMEKSSKFKFLTSVPLLQWGLIFFTRQNLMLRLSENAACTQTTLGDNSSLRADDSIEQSEDASVLGKLAWTNFDI